MGNIGQHTDAVRTIHELRERAERAERKAARWRELYESATAIVRRLQSERESLLARVRAALLGITLED